MKAIWIVLILVLTSCGDKMENSIEIEEITTEIGLLPKLISLPEKTKSVKWKVPIESNTQASNLIVLLEFSAEDFASIIEGSTALSENAKTMFSKDFYENWVPSSLKLKIEKIDSDDGFILPGVQGYQPSLFTKTALSPFVNGVVYALGDNYLLLDLYSM